MSTAEHVTREHFDATVGELKALIMQMAKQPEQSPTMTIEEAMALTGHGSKSGFRTWAAKWNLVTFASCRYRRDDVRAAIARSALSAGNGVKRKKRLPKENLAA